MPLSRTFSVSCAAAVLALASAVAGSASVSRTIVTSYHPGGLVGSTLKGSCWTSSIASNRSDAFRCNAGNDIYDPCFRVRATLVGCPTNAISDRGVYLAVTSLPSNHGGSDVAWAMELSDATYCTMLTGTTISGYPFGCGSGSMVCSMPQPASPQYHVTCGNGSGMRVTSSRSYRVAHIWM